MTRRVIPQWNARVDSKPSHEQQPHPAQCTTPDRISTHQKTVATDLPVEKHPTSHDSTEAFYVIITTSLLIPGDGEPLKDGALVIRDKLIDWVGRQADMPPKYLSHPHRRHEVPYLMPGLWDCHVHFAGENEEAAVESGVTGMMWHADNPATAAARLVKGCWESVQRGYTSMRDLSGYGCELAQAIEEGSVVGPNVYGAGAALSQVAGHGDVFALPAGDALLNFGVSQIRPGYHTTAVSCIVNGPDECRLGVRLQIRRGARCIKVMATGGLASRDDDPDVAQFSRGELQAIVEEATRMKRPVAAHAHGKAGILAAVEAGVGTIEHASMADEECMHLIKQKGVVYVATRTVIDLSLRSGGEGMSKKIWDKTLRVGSHHLGSYKLAVASGVTIALGTDTSPGFNMAVELEHAVAAGLSNLEAIKAATANGPLTVKGQAPLTGQLKAGYEADVIGLSENPVDDVRVLQKKSNIVWVWKGGKAFKGPGIGPWGEEELEE
ncbi:hypothetical protein PWT90_04139 [Aphanocladium album]|nr:hypothetical protein PWT90_04139 [Aphanocladium album]